MTLQGFYTNLGQALAAKVAAGSTTLTITRVVAGSGHTADPASATSLPDIRQTLAVGSPSISGSTATIPVTLAEVQAGSPYSLTELGVYATDPDAGEILFQIYQLNTSALITAGGENVLRFYLRQTIGAQGVTVTCSPAGLLTEGDLHPRLLVMARHPENFTYHVAKDGSDVTGDGSEQHPFLTLQKAIDTLPKLLLGYTTIMLHAGQYQEDIWMEGFSGYYLQIRGESKETVSLKTIRIRRCNLGSFILSDLTMYGISSDTYNWTIYLENLAECVMRNIDCLTAPTYQGGLGAIRIETVAMAILEAMNISNKLIAIDVMASQVYLRSDVVGTGNTVAIRSGSGYGDKGSLVVKGAATIAGEIQKEYGGQVW